MTPEEVASAHETGLSCGKYRAFLELQLLDPDITRIGDCLADW